MKKLLFLLVFLPSFVFGQNHLSFMGIRLGQSENAFCQKLKSKGFQYVGVNNVMHTKMFEGTFWKFQDTRINVERENGSATSVLVGLSVKAYNSIDNFTDLVKGFDKKYGKHHSISVFFKVSEMAGNNGYYWKVNGGYIATYYDKNPINNEIMIGIRYMDNTNCRIILENGRRRNTNDDL